MLSGVDVMVNFMKFSWRENLIEIFQKFHCVKFW